MEFPGLGARCSHADCHQIDFLPLACACGAALCRAHYLSHALACPSAAAAPSPPTHPPLTAAAPPAHCCSGAGCERRDLLEMLCPKCARHHCIEHRFHPECPEIDEETLAAKREELAAPQRQFEQSNKPLQLQITENIRRALQSSAKVKTAAKIHLMRVKQKAVGSKTIPTSDRVYFSIMKPKDTTAKSVTRVNDSDELVPVQSLNIDPDTRGSVPVFISKKWTLGRAIDNMSEVCAVSNENNKPGLHKVRLFRRIDGYCVAPARADAEIGELMARGVLVEGDQLVLEYITNEELSTVNQLTQMFLVFPIETEM